jgi:hypothetical protein
VARLDLRRAIVSRTRVRQPELGSHEHTHREHHDDRHHGHDDDACPATPDPRCPPKPARISVARQVKQQRRGYATAVLRTLARTHQGRPATQINATLRSSLTPLGVRLSPATLRDLAADIAAGRPVELP